MTSVVPDPDPQAFRALVANFATGVTVTTTRYGDILHGMTANAFASVSLDPLLVLVCIDRQAGMHDLVATAGAFAVTILADDQRDEAVWFASPRRPEGDAQFAQVPWQSAPVTGCPVLARGIAYLDCRLHARHDGGDHTIVLGAVVAQGLLRPDHGPLLWHQGLYKDLSV